MSKQIVIQLSPFGPLIERRSDIDSNIQIKSAIEDFFDVASASEISEEHIKKYIEITPKELHMALGLARTYSEIYSRIVTPLNRAKKHYCNGHYSESILLSSLAIEMLALLMWTITPYAKSLADEDFDVLGLEKKIEVLAENRIIPQFIETKMHSVRKTRNKYAHAWKDFSRIEKGDARRCFLYSMEVFTRVAKVSLKVVDGKQLIDVNAQLLKFRKEVN